MSVVEHAAIEPVSLPGIEHRTVAGPRDGLKSLEVWVQTLAPGAETPLHRHDCEEVVVVLAGAGRCEINGEVQVFGPGSTIIVPPNAVHRLVVTSEEEMRVVAAVGMAPVTVETPDGARLPLPWDQHHLAR
uniref:Cupin domain-containing protein n=1 Tax=Jahnella sp. MSr9139 TaxID=1434086 RepID=A0A3Q8I3S9_9BACT|nr:hypothetical protein [Jahnella sp. MSr9139]